MSVHMLNQWSIFKHSLVFEDPFIFHIFLIISSPLFLCLLIYFSTIVSRDHRAKKKKKMKHGEKEIGKKYKVPVPLTKTEIASLLAAV